MKSFHLTVWIVLALFVGVMGTVVYTSCLRKSNSCKLDTSRMGEYREMVRTR